MNKIKDIEAFQKALNFSHSEYWRDGVLEPEKKDIKPLAITPTRRFRSWMPLRSLTPSVIR